MSRHQVEPLAYFDAHVQRLIVVVVGIVFTLWTAANETNQRQTRAATD